MTSFSDIYDKFFEKMEADENFFNYFNLDEEQAMSLARSRAHTYLLESISVIIRKYDYDAVSNFESYDDDLEIFNEDLTLDEVDMLAALMYEQEYKRQFSKLKAFEIQHIPNTLQVFSPANERKTVQAMISYIHEENMTMLDNYVAKNRTTRQLKTIDYDAYDAQQSD